jgi:hypothetical protein
MLSKFYADGPHISMILAISLQILPSRPINQNNGTNGCSNPTKTCALPPSLYYFYWNRQNLYQPSSLRREWGATKLIYTFEYTTSKEPRLQWVQADMKKQNTIPCYTVYIYTFEYNQLKVSSQTESISPTKWLSLVVGPLPVCIVHKWLLIPAVH